MEKTAVVTGAASGLGRQLARDLAARGFRLALGDRDAPGLEETARRAGLSQDRLAVVPTDVTKETDCRALVERAVSAFGRLDCLILCAGISMWARFDELRDLSVFRRLMEVNYLGAVYCVHAALPALLATRGTVVAVSSLQGEVALPHHTGYAASKHALNGFLEGLEFEMGDRIGILNVMPGWITGTGLRARAFTGGGERSETPRKHSRESVTVEDCSARIIRAIERGRRTLFVPPKLRHLVWMQAIAPGLVRRLIARAVDKQR
jgi:NAD(P)-dependent dehydrogenase (short-subunit alcohol dehydrogenase family)